MSRQILSERGGANLHENNMCISCHTCMRVRAHWSLSIQSAARLKNEIRSGKNGNAGSFAAVDRGSVAFWCRDGCIHQRPQTASIRVGQVHAV